MSSPAVTWLRGLSPGVRYMIASAFAFSLMNLLVKLTGQRLPSAEVVLCRSVVSLAISYVMVRRAGVYLWGRNRKGLVFRGLIGFAGLLCFFYAIPRLPLAEATMLQFTHPVWTTLLAAIVLGERLTRTVLAGVLLGLVGVVLIARPGGLTGASTLDPGAVGLTLLGAVCASIAYVTVRQISRTEHPLVIVFYFPLVSVPASIPFMAAHAVWPTPMEWLMLLGIGVCTQMGQVYLTKSLHAEAASRVSSVSYVQIVFAAAWGALAFGEYPDAMSLAGAALVIGGVLLAARKIRPPLANAVEAPDAGDDVPPGAADQRSSSSTSEA